MLSPEGLLSGGRWYHHRAMRAWIDFDGLADLVLGGACAVESCPEVEAWPVTSDNLRGEVVVIMHRDNPGAVCLFGVVDSRPVLVGCYSSRLREVTAQRFARFFRFDSQRAPDASVRFVFDAVVKASRSDDVSAFDDLRFVFGAEGAELISELRRLQRLAAGSPDGVLH